LATVREIHVAGGRVSDKDPSRYIDSHSDSICSVVLEMLEWVLPHCPRLEAITFEIGVNISEHLVDEGLSIISSIVSYCGLAPRITNKQP
jgi:uncharacterized protein (UPF0276 family)